MAVVVIDGQCAPLFPYELRWRCDALRAVLLPYPIKQTCILKSSLCLGSHCSRDVFTPIQPLSKCLRRRAGERFSISCKKSDTCSSILFAYLRSVASAIVCPIVGSWQNAIVATRMACSRVSFVLARLFWACLCKRSRSLLRRFNSAEISCMSKAAAWIRKKLCWIQMSVGCSHSQVVDIVKRKT